MNTQSYEIGMVGLGVMGRNLLLNMADHGYSVAGYDKDVSKVAALRQEAQHRDIRGAETVLEFVSLLRVPRAVMMLVPAGTPVDAVIHDLLPCLARGDLIIDAGNSYFNDTNLRAKALAERRIQFLGVGVSGGEHGARHGPSIMPGGPKDAYERVRADLGSSCRQGEGRTLCHLAWTRLGRTFREDGPQRHRVRHDAAYRRDLRSDETRARP